MQAPSFYHGWVGAAEFLAILFPLLGFYCLHRAKENSLWFVAALFAGFASAGTVANGLLVLPIMTAMSALIGLGVRRTLFLAALSTVSFVLYFWGFTYPDHPRPDPATAILFVLTYLGSPFYYVVYYWLGGLQHLVELVSGHGSLLVTNNYLDYPISRMSGIIVAAIAGGILTAAVAAVGLRWLRSERTDTCQAALLAFIGFIFATAVLASIGRGFYGFDYAVQERYTTGPLLAWQALAILLLSRLDKRKTLNVLAMLVVLIPIALLPDQMKAILKPDAQDQVGRDASLKALRTGWSNDEAVDRQVKRLKEMGIVLGQ